MSLSVKALNLSRGGHRLLRQCDLRLERGEVLAVLGPNGAGKSTLLAALAGQYRQDMGVISWDGTRVTAMDAMLRPRLIGYSPQQVEPAWGIPVAAMLQTALRARGARPDAAIADSLAAFDLESLRDRPITALSGGETKRLSLAVASIGNPPLLLLDEPFAALDLGHQANLRRWIGARAAAGQSIIASLHDPNDALRIAHRVLVLCPDGRFLLGDALDMLVPSLIADVWGVAMQRFNGPEGPYLVPAGGG